MTSNVKPKKYIVWKRLPDGYIAASLGHLPKGWTYPDGTVDVTFEQLAEFDEWSDAHEFIAHARYDSESEKI